MRNSTGKSRDLEAMNQVKKSPNRATNSLRLWLLCLAAAALACAVCYMWVDRPVASLFHRAQLRPGTFGRLTLLPDPFVPLAVIAFFTLGLWHLSGRELSRMQTSILLCSISILVAEITKAQLKYVFGRSWPDTWTHNNPSFIRDGVYGFHFFHGGSGYASFPSGHMAVTCAALVVLWTQFPAGRFAYVLVAVAVAVGLVGANFHFVSDVIAGGFVGFSSAWMTLLLWKTDSPR